MSHLCSPSELRALTGTTNRRKQVTRLAEYRVEARIIQGFVIARRLDVMDAQRGIDSMVEMNLEVLDRQPKRNRVSLEQQRIRALFSSQKRGAAKRGIEWRITADDMERLFSRSGGRCEVTGAEFQYDAHPSASKRPYAPSLDRKDSAKGYTVDNCRIVCVAANMAMNQWGDQVLIDMARAMIETGKIRK